jgi:NAD(P)-dependent dehydrogenase (short-subunit alcohol dehydrogenase family)
MIDKICVITGANSGVGFEASRLLAKEGADLILVCRDRGRGEAAMETIMRESPAAKLRLEVADLSSLGQVRHLGAALVGSLPTVDLLVNNAAVIRAGFEETEDGLERTMAVNHLSHFLLTQLLLDRLIASNGRVITVSSEAHRRGRLSSGTLEETLRGPARYSGMQAYSDSKLANILFTAELARRHPVDELSACSVHPGVLATRIWNQNRTLMSFFMVLLKPIMGRPAVGGESVAYLAGEPAETVHGRYFNEKKEAWPSPPARDGELAKDLWDLSLELTGLPPASLPGEG